jgi:hypothetical protein
MQNVEAEFFQEFILISENIQLQTVIGEDLYKVIVDEMRIFLDSGTPLSSRVKTLIDNYIQIMLLYYTLYHALPHLNIKHTNAGEEKQHTRNSSSASVGEIQLQRKQWLNFAEHYSVEMLKFLNDNLTLYPEYEGSCTISSKNNITGLYLGKNI